MDSRLDRAIEFIKIGEKSKARKLLREILKSDPRNEEAWIWMSGILDDVKQRRLCLNNALKINPDNELAKKGLAALEKGDRKPKPTPDVSPKTVDAEPFDFSAPAQPSPPTRPNLARTPAKPASLFGRLVLKLLNTMYWVSHSVDQVKSKYPEADIVAAGGTKARRFEPGEEITLRGYNWMLAYRGAVILTDKAVICGPWEIPLSEITAATLTPFAGNFTQNLMLQITTYRDEKYVFGLGYDPAWINQNVLDMEVKEQRVFIGAYVARSLLLLLFVCFLAQLCILFFVR